MLTIEVKRRRISLVQGEADIYVNSQFVMTFGDTIQLISPGKKYYGERIGNWASVIPDSAFIKGLFYHPYDLVYHYSDKAKEPIFLTAAPKEGGCHSCRTNSSHCRECICPHCDLFQTPNCLEGVDLCDRVCDNRSHTSTCALSNEENPEG